MEKKTIWHTPDEKPMIGCKIFFYTKIDNFLCVGNYNAGCFYDDPDTDFEIEYKADDISEWAYVSKVMSASKALDVAIDALKNATEYLGNQNPLYEVEVMKLYIDLSKAVEKIESIMKGDKSLK